MYCTRCRSVFEGDRCPNCKHGTVREPQAEDICFLTELSPMYGGMLEDVLKQNGIPVLTESTKGAALAVISGPLFEWIKYYVRYDHLPRAKEIVEELFDSPSAETEQEEIQNNEADEPEEEEENKSDSEL